MTKIKLHSQFKTIKNIFPTFLSDGIRKTVTAFLTPIRFSVNSGHFKSSFLKKSVNKNGQAIPWYTYPCFDFLRVRDFSQSEILEFGAGQSTFWWAKNAKFVTAFEGRKPWLDYLKKTIPNNVKLQLVSIANATECENDVSDFLKSNQKKYDVLIIDGLHRAQMIPFAISYLNPGGIIICDNSDGYGIYEGFLNSGFKKVDFYGYAPGVVLPHCTSIYFNDDCTFFDSAIPTKVIVLED